MYSLNKFFHTIFLLLPTLKMLLLLTVLG